MSQKAPIARHIMSVCATFNSYNYLLQLLIAFSEHVSALSTPIFLGRDALYRAKAAYSTLNIPSNHQLVCLSVQCTVTKWLIGYGCGWDGRSDGSRNKAGSWVWGPVHRMG